MNVDPAFLSFLQEEEARAYDGTLLEEVEAAINSYNGADYGDEEDGRSRAVTRDVAETTDYMLTSVQDVFVSSGRVVEFEPQNEGDEDQCDDATEAMHVFFRKKSGYRFIHDWAKSGLLEKIGIAKTCIEKKKKRVEHIVPDLMLAEDLRAQGIIEAEDTGQTDEMGNALWHVVSLEDQPVQFRDYNVPLEEFRAAPDTGTDLDASPYLCHLTQKTLSELVEMGFDADLVTDAQTEADPTSTTLALARDDGRSRSDFGGLDRTGANRKVWLREEYVLFDLNGDGISERLCVHRVGTVILDLKEVDYQPFEYWCPYPMQGRLIGQSLADKTMDLQRINSVILRNGLDSIYSQVAPGHYVSEDCENEHTIDDLLTVRPNRLVRYKGVQPPIPEQKQDISQIAFAAMEQMTRIRESRTGITRLNKGVDEDTLNETAKGQARLMSRGQQMERYIIRNFAEGVARLFMKKVGLMRRYGQPFQIRVDGEYRNVNPQQWPEGMEVQVVVGLGSGSKEDRIMSRQMLGQVQGMLKQSGSPIVTDENMYNNAVGLARDMGLPPNDLFTDIPRDEQGQPLPQQPQPDPKMMEVQAKLQMEQMKHQQDSQIKAAELQQSAQEGALKLQLMREEAAAKLQLEREKAQAEAMMNEQRLQMELRLKEREMQIKEHMAQRDADRRDEETKLKANREGGKLDK